MNCCETFIVCICFDEICILGILLLIVRVECGRDTKIIKKSFVDC